APPKSKTQKMSLGDFLGDQSLGSWADEMEDMPLTKSRTGYGGDRRAFSSNAGFARTDNPGYAQREQLPLPTKPPFTAYLGNLSFDATEGDIQDFFSGCDVTSVRIVEDKMERKPKGFGYVEFGNLDGLKKALELHGTQFQGRNVRISVADASRYIKDRPEQRTFDDWTRRGPLPDLPNNQQRRTSERGFGRNFEPAAGSDAGSERGERRRGPAFESDKVRDFGNWERKGPLSPVPSAAPMREGGRVRSNDGPSRERKNSPSWGEGRSQEGSRPPRREFQDRPPPVERQPTAAEMDNQWRSKMKPDAPAKSPVPTPEASTPSSPAAAAPPTTRPRLNLQKRTVSEAEPSTPAAGGDPKSSPFGAARPIDTAAREKEVEEKRQLALRSKKEQEEKAREEKRAAKSYEILRRVDDDNNDANDTDANEGANGGANGDIVDDKAVKPKEVTRPAPKQQGGGSWRKKPSTPSTPAESTTDALAEEGWSTVPSKQKNQRRGGGNQGARAIAS
ncbi:RNA-binding domain-containing protein, partial [Patellaria atrata CBS 101060]